MSDQRTLTLTTPQQKLKLASKELIIACDGQEEAAEHLGTRQQRMSDCGLKNTDKFLTIDEAARLEDISDGKTGHPIVTRLMAKRQGYTLVRLPPVSVERHDLLVLIAEQARENGNIANAVLMAIADNEISAGECDEIEELIDREIELAVALRANVRHIRDKGMGL